MPTLYITEPGATLRALGSSLVVTVDRDPDGAGPAPRSRKVLIEVEPHRLEGVALVGHTNATTAAVQMLLEQGIQLAWLKRNGDPLARLVPAGAKASDLRLAQYAAVMDGGGRLLRARAVVAAKCQNALAVLRGIQSNNAGEPGLGGAIEALGASMADAALATNIAVLLGVEGNAARAYFGGLACGFKGAIRFGVRARRPPPDPANALLSLGYVLLGQRLEGALEARGLDPALGFYHEVKAGRSSLALDLVEELRHPLVDRFVLSACNLRVFGPEDFEAADEPGGVQLTAPAMKRFLERWEEALERPLREEGGASLDALALIRRQADRLAADLRGGAAYQPFRAAL